MNTIKCKQCGTEIEISAALQGQVKDQILAAEHRKHEAEMEGLRQSLEQQLKRETSAATQRAQQQLEAERQLVRQQAKTELDIERQRIAAEANAKQKNAAMQQDMTLKALQADAAAEKEANSQLRQQISELMQQLRESNQARQNAELEAQKKFAAEEEKLREQLARDADERQRLKIMEKEKQLQDALKVNETLQRKLQQGSQQNQGEVLELDLEAKLRDEFPFDAIEEVKKGARGADIKQIVRNGRAADCGTILWETKNGKWQPAWVGKFKQDIRDAGANVGVIVSQEMPTEMGDMKHLEENVWVVCPRLAPRLAAALRITILQVAAANQMSAGKDAKMEALYQFLTGPEFRHRVEAIIENYTILQDEVEKEKRAYALKWARQERAIRAVIDNTIGMYGDFQGITNRALPTITTLELEEEVELDALPEVKVQASLLP